MDHLGIRSVNGWIDKFWASIEKTPDCWYWKSGKRLADPYGEITVPVHSPRGPAWRTERVHRLAWELANDRRIPGGKYILHACDNRRCVRPEHLRIGTARDNAADKTQRGRNRGGLPFGHPPTNAKLTPADVRAIRAAYRGFRAGVSMRSLAMRHGVSIGAVYDILRSKTWVNVK